MQSLIEYHPIKHAINEIAQSAGVNQTCANDEAPMIALFYNPSQVPGSEDHSRHPEQCEYDFPGFVAELPTPGHARVLNKIEPEPADIGNISVSGWKIRLDPDLQSLISHQNQNYNKNNIANLQNQMFSLQI